MGMLEDVARVVSEQKEMKVRGHMPNIIYRIWRSTPDGDKSYIGQTKNIKGRMDNHLSNAKRLEMPMQQDIRQFGPDAFNVEIIFVSFNPKHLSYLEDDLIETFGSLAPSGYNLQDSGSKAQPRKYKSAVRTEDTTYEKEVEAGRVKPMRTTDAMNDPAVKWYLGSPCNKDPSHIRDDGYTVRKKTGACRACANEQSSHTKTLTRKSLDERRSDIANGTTHLKGCHEGVIEIPVAEIETSLRFDESTGLGYWIVSRGTAKAGSVAGTVNKDTGYRQIRFNGTLYRWPRVVMAVWGGGILPTETVDHINGNRDDNRLCNLRRVNISQNNLNMASTKGVSYVKRDDRWRVKMQISGLVARLGQSFKTEEAALSRYNAVKARIGNLFSDSDPYNIQALEALLAGTEAEKRIARLLALTPSKASQREIDRLLPLLLPCSSLPRFY